MKRIVFIGLTLTGILIGHQSCNDINKEKVLTKEVVFTKEGEIKLKKVETDSILVTLDTEFAETEYETQIGLMYRHSMEDHQSMFFIFEKNEPRGFYMKNTEFPLDIIFINSKNEIVSIQKNAKPFDKSTLQSGAPAKYVLEINAGLSDSWGLEAGDLVEWNKMNQK
jgi:uncharacterized membrane protein (UPF0127 family)